MNSFLIAALAFAFSQITLSALLLLPRFRSWTLAAWLLVLMLLCTIGYLLQPLMIGHRLEPLRLVFEGSLPGLFWLLCSSLFNDRFRLRAWNVALAAITVVIPNFGRALRAFDIHVPQWLFFTVPQGLEFVLLALALTAVVQHWHVDLVEERRRLRLGFCAVTGVYIFILVSMREVLFPDSEWLAVWQYAPVGFICLTANLLFLQYRPGLITHEVVNDRPSEVSATPEPFNIPDEVEQALQRIMMEQNAYREMGLTIGQLAQRIDLPEYRLRKIINAGLGFRNFNDYLNGYRIREAGARLSDPEQVEQAVLNIALEVGFRSLSTFNKAFREAYGVTPTVYRQQQLSSI